jgi:hypothetical protein
MFHKRTLLSGKGPSQHSQNPSGARSKGMSEPLTLITGVISQELAERLRALMARSERCMKDARRICADMDRIQARVADLLQKNAELLRV